MVNNFYHAGIAHVLILRVFLVASLSSSLEKVVVKFATVRQPELGVYFWLIKKIQVFVTS